MDKEQAVRDAAISLQTAIADAVAAGYRVSWPNNPADLDKIAISETGRMKPPAESTAAPATSRPVTFGRPIE